MEKYKDLFEHDNLESFWIKIVQDNVFYYGNKLIDVVHKYWSPLKIYNLNVITDRIKKVQWYFNNSIDNNDYKWNYTYCYCTKSNHFSFVLDTILWDRNKELDTWSVHLETSSSFDSDIISHLDINNDTFIIHNWFKSNTYLESIKNLSEKYKNSICVLDSLDEIDRLWSFIKWEYKVWIRMSTNESWKWFENSRLWIPMDDLSDFIENKLSKYPNFDLKMLHFFMNFWIKDDDKYYDWLRKHVEMYCEIKKKSNSLDILNIWWWLPIRFWFDENYDYENIINNIIKIIKEVCDLNNVDHPNIFTEFWSYTVWESAVNIYTVLNEKNQNKNENWYMIDSSFITTIPDSWWLSQTFPVFPLNNLWNDYKRILFWWITCDKDDYLKNKIDNYFYFPVLSENNKLFFMVMHTWAYQENISGYGIWWLSHCQLDWEKILVIDKNWNIDVFFDWNDTNERLRTLWYLN